MKILHVVGTRPNFVKAAPVMKALAARGAAQVLVHTGQHYDAAMSQVFFEELGLPKPDHNLGVGSGTHAYQTGEVMKLIEPVLLETRPDGVLVYGDVNSTVAAALTCAKAGFPVAHVEAGLRSRDRTMPEELNRIVTDHVADLLLTPSEDGSENLRAEGIPAERIRLVGNVMIDSLTAFAPAARRVAPLAVPRPYGLVTLHRPSNVDDPSQLVELVGALNRVAEALPLVFPAHPRTVRRLGEIGAVRLGPRVTLLPPLGYLEFLRAMMEAAVVLTDSGGIQEETTCLGVPCLTLRENTERPITVWLGTNTLVGADYARLEAEVAAVLAGRGKRGRIPPLWDGHAGERIADILCSEGIPSAAGQAPSA